MSKLEINTVFDAPRRIVDERAREVLSKYGLPNDGSLAEIETVATALLHNPKTLFDGMEMVLGRRVDTKELQDTPDQRSMLPLVGLADNGKDRFGLLLFQVTLEMEKSGEQKANK